MSARSNNPYCQPKPIHREIEDRLVELYMKILTEGVVKRHPRTGVEVRCTPPASYLRCICEYLKMKGVGKVKGPMQALMEVVTAERSGNPFKASTHEED